MGLHKCRWRNGAPLTIDYEAAEFAYNVELADDFLDITRKKEKEAELVCSLWKAVAFQAQILNPIYHAAQNPMGRVKMARLINKKRISE